MGPPILYSLWLGFFRSVVMKRVLLVILLGCLLAPSAYSQREKKIVKIGCIDMQKIIDKVAADRALKNILQSGKKEFLKKAKKLSREIKKLKTILEKEGTTLTKARREDIQEEIITKEEQLEKYLNQKSQVLRQREQILTQDILINIYNLIKEVAITEGYSMILEKNTAVVYVEEELDITPAVIKALEKKKEKFGVR